MTMPAVEALSSITPGIAPMLDALVAASGWNQTAHDWRLFERLGTVHGVRDGEGQLVASGAVLPMDAVAWISMILVMPAARGQGQGRAVFAHCLAQVKAAGLVAMLDATPQGEPLYASFGFTPLWRLTRWQREAAPATASLATDKPALDNLAALDAQALGFARPAVLADLLGRSDSRCVRNGLGFGLVRAGRTAHHIGPLLSSDEATAAALLTQAARGLDGRIYVDVPDDRKAMTAALRTAGFTPQRSFARMALATRDGTQPPTGHPAFIHAIAGPEFA
ncbi:GNAT family N-acetyltransferase [Variovorax boronicumulans]|uniref:GNAT family N-acetyltransferase n=1 Tax=Variovorax boronicumulans TaxID=436515 RepID=UPI0012E52698|nr:GNAT family N-acetyltransferase [Variovorax boronicumulans]GER20369.1 GNAT family N-acetyltransferase [Variovorax boronicumulans]